MSTELSPGISHTSQQIVTTEHSASSLGSGMVEVFATPAMVALMENAAMLAVLPHLPEGQNTVGAEISVKHIKATPIGMTVHSKATLTGVENRKLEFEVTAWDEEGEIGKGRHTRYVIDVERFMGKLKG
ncbi:thioesterase [Chitinispirillum alkaliphilum]|nr:thioesterase [Chitinispirillum alkaliphilum]